MYLNTEIPKSNNMTEHFRGCRHSKHKAGDQTRFPPPAPLRGSRLTLNDILHISAPRPCAPFGSALFRTPPRPGAARGRGGAQGRRLPPARLCAHELLAIIPPAPLKVWVVCVCLCVVVVLWAFFFVLFPWRGCRKRSSC